MRACREEVFLLCSFLFKNGPEEQRTEVTICDARPHGRGAHRLTPCDLPPRQPKAPLHSLTSPPWEPPAFPNPSKPPPINASPRAHPRMVSPWAAGVLFPRLSCDDSHRPCKRTPPPAPPCVPPCTAPHPVPAPPTTERRPASTSLPRCPWLLRHSGGAIAEWDETRTPASPRAAGSCSRGLCRGSIRHKGHRPPARQGAPFPPPHSFRAPSICTNVYSFVNLTESRLG